MTTGYIPLDYGHVALAATLLVLNALLSYALELRLERQSRARGRRTAAAGLAATEPLCDR